MIDFLMISTRSTKRGVIEIYPKFIIPTKKKSDDLMIRGGDFYAIWIEELGLWSTDENDALRIIDMELDRYVEANANKIGDNYKVLHMWDAESGMIDRWHRYCQKQLRDSFNMLDEKLIFSNMKIKKTDYASRQLNYPLEPCETPAYDRLMSVLYSDEERQKIEWAIGSIVNGDSKKIQKFLVLYGAAGTGKSTVLNIIQQLFEGYYSVFDARSLGSSNNSFALESFRSNPLVAIQHDGDLSHIEDNTRLNSLVSHEMMTVNEKFKSTYSTRFKSFLFMGTNKPVKITDSKSGLIRRLIDVTPSGETVSQNEYKKLVKQIEFELGGIALHCRDVYLANRDLYDNYIPVRMLGASNDFYNFILDAYLTFKKDDETTLKAAWEMYKSYCEYSRVNYPLVMRAFKEELKTYFKEYAERGITEDGTRVRNYYTGFLANKVDGIDDSVEEVEINQSWLIFEEQESVFDATCADCLAQYATEDGKPKKKWANVKTQLSDIDTSKLHYVRVPAHHIVIDFDIPDETGEKSYGRNLEEASKWPPTYGELSKSGAGIHLHYIYTGDPSRLKNVYGDHIEIKVFNGDSSLRRKLTKCNNHKIAEISSGLPTKGEKMVNFDSVKSEKGLRDLIKRNLNKEIHPGTKPSIDFIYKILEDAYASGLKYDVTDLRQGVLIFATNSTNQADYCIKLVNKMKFKSDDASDSVPNEEADLIFYDIEVFPNLFLVNWKFPGEEKPVVRMINPKRAEIEELMRFRLVGFNCRRYDNHVLYACLLGYNNEQLYNLSQKIVSGKGGFFGEAYNVSYTDVYDFAATKQSLKKWEIELGIHHQELGLPWDEPVPEELWIKVAEYCDNDVIATEAVFNHLKGDFTARQILAKLANGTVNDTTNSLTTKIIFAGNRKPQDQFNYRFMGTDAPPFDMELKDYTVFDNKGRPEFPGYTFDHGKSLYRGEEVGEGGYVYAEPGIHVNVALLDVASMHPSSVVAENLFGDEYTQRFKDILDARIAIKKKDFDKAKKMLGGALAEYLTDESTAKELAQALKIAINSVYGLTAANFDNAFRDQRNIDNIVAKRGALFMINLKYEVQARGFTVAHIKTDSIKIPNATPEIIQFVMDYGKQYGYTFEHEATYDRMCLVNDAVYIARYEGITDPKDGAVSPGEWTATGTQFQVPYVFKSLFSKEEITFDDMCETRSVREGEIYLDMDENLPDVTGYEKELVKAEKAYRDALKDEDEYAVAVQNLKVELDRTHEELDPKIAEGHDYIFVGRVGRFCPMKPGTGGGLLYRKKDGKFYAVTGTKGYRWLEAEIVKELGKKADIDESYYISLADEAVETIRKYGDFDRFVAEEPYASGAPSPDFMNIPTTDKEELTWEEYQQLVDDEHAMPFN